MADEALLTSIFAEVKQTNLAVSDIKIGMVTVQGDVKSLVADRDDHETRLRSLEKFRYMIWGGMIVINALAVWVMYVLTSKH